MRRLAHLPQACERPDVVEIWDVTAVDPKLLVYLKVGWLASELANWAELCVAGMLLVRLSGQQEAAGQCCSRVWLADRLLAHMPGRSPPPLPPLPLQAYRNTVSIPRHWSQKRKYLQGKRGLDKPPFKLPEFIEATGISEQPAPQAQSLPCLQAAFTLHPPLFACSHVPLLVPIMLPCPPSSAGEMRQAYLEKVDSQKMKQKARERMQPKMGKLDIDYQVGFRVAACPR